MKNNKPLVRKSWLNQKRAKPRQKRPERVQYERSKPKAGDDPTAEERRHMTRVRAKPCLVCGRASTLHHVTGWADRPGRFTRSHKLVVPLCAVHHQKVFDPVDADPVSVEGLSHEGFFIKHQIDLLKVAETLWQESIQCEHG